jgi:hypothetical protein
MNGKRLPPELGQQILQRVAEGQSADGVALRLGHTPETIRTCLSDLGAQLAPPSQRPSLLRRALAFRNELVASFLSRRESRHAAQATRQLLTLHWIVAGQHPHLPRRDIYRRVVMAYTGVDEDEADMVLRRAEQSFATWPNERELTFADVVHYVAVSQYLTGDERISTRIDMGRLVAGRVPPHL